MGNWELAVAWPPGYHGRSPAADLPLGRPTPTSIATFALAARRPLSRRPASAAAMSAVRPANRRAARSIMDLRASAVVASASCATSMTATGYCWCRSSVTPAEIAVPTPGHDRAAGRLPRLASRTACASASKAASRSSSRSCKRAAHGQISAERRALDHRAHMRSSSRPGCAKCPSNGCGATGAGRYRGSHSVASFASASGAAQALECPVLQPQQRHSCMSVAPYARHGISPRSRSARPSPSASFAVRLERMIHFVPPHNEKVRGAGAGDDARPGRRDPRQPRGRHPGRRQGRRPRRRYRMRPWPTGRRLRRTGLWTRVNALNSPWVLDDVTEIVTKAGDKLDVIMLPKVEGPWDIHYARPAASPSSRPSRRSRARSCSTPSSRPRQGVTNVEEIAGASPAHAGHSRLGPADLAAIARHEDHARRRRPPRRTGDRADPDAEGRERVAAPAGPVALHARRRWSTPASQAGIKPFYGPFGDISDAAGAARQQFRNAFLHGLRRRLVAAPRPDRHRQARLLARSRTR